VLAPQVQQAYSGAPQTAAGQAETLAVRGLGVFFLVILAEGIFLAVSVRPRGLPSCLRLAALAPCSDVAEVVSWALATPASALLWRRNIICITAEAVSPQLQVSAASAQLQQGVTSLLQGWAATALPGLLLPLGSLQRVPLFQAGGGGPQGFLPDELDRFAESTLYPSFSPTVGAFLLCSAAYGLWKVWGLCEALLLLALYAASGLLGAACAGAILLCSVAVL